jgi:hypothetical protein
MQAPHEEITIDADGNFSVRIVGVKGPACAQLQDKFLAVGKQTKEEITPEYQEQEFVFEQHGVSLKSF